MSNLLTKDELYVPGGEGTPGTPGTSPRPAYCVDIPHTAPAYRYVLVNVFDEHGFFIGYEWIAISIGLRTTIEHRCFPATPGVPATPGQPGSPPTTIMQIGWNAGATSIDTLPGSGEYTFSIKQRAIGVVTGLNYFNNGVGYIEIPYGFYCRNGLYSVVERGAVKTAPVPFVEADVFAVVCMGTIVQYYVGTTLVYTSAVPRSGTLFADASMFMAGDQIINAALVQTVSTAHGEQSGGSNGTIRLIGTAFTGDNAGHAFGDIVLSGVAASYEHPSVEGVIRLTGRNVVNGVNYTRGVLTPLTGRAESGLFIPNYSIVRGQLQPLQGFSIGIFGRVGAVTGILRPLSGHALSGVNAGHAFGHLYLTGDAASGILQPGMGIMRGDARFRPLQVSIQYTVGGHDTGAGRLQKLRARGYTGHRATGRLRQLTSSGTLIARETMTGAVSLHPLVGAGHLLTGYTMVGAARFSRMRVSGRTGHRAAGTLQRITAAGTLTANETLRGAVALQGLRATGNTSVYGYLMSGAVVLPALVGGGSFRGTAVLSGLTAQGVLTDTAGVFEGWIYNVRSGSVTRLTNLPFTQLLQVPGGPLLGISTNGNVYSLDGETDAGVRIPWLLETGLHDFGQAGMKRIPYLYMDALIEGKIQIAILTDKTSKTYSYNYEAVADAGHHPHKKRIGNAIYTRSVGVRLSSTDGVYVEVDNLEPELDITQRSV